MSSTTPNLALTLYDSTTDQTVPFATFRAVWGGPTTTSNFYKIDTAYGTLSSQITALQATKGAVRVAASYVSANYYEATGITSITAYTTGISIILSLDTTSSGTVTLNINGLGTKSVMKVNSSGVATNLTGSDLTKGRYYLFNYDGTRWLWVSANTADQINIVGTSGNVVTVGSDNSLLGTTTQAGLIADTIHAATSKSTPVDADEIPLVDSAATYALKKLTIANLKTLIGTALGSLISGFTAKSTPVDADTIALSDSAASNATKKLSWSDLKATIMSSFGALINAQTAKSTPADADMIIIADSASSNATKKSTFTNLKSYFKTYMDTLYAPVAKGVTNGDSHNHRGGDGAPIPQMIGTHGENAGVPASSLYYAVPFGTGMSSSARNGIVTRDGVLKNLYVRSGGQPATGSVVVTVFVENVATSLVVTIPAGSSVGTYSDTTHSVTALAGNSVRFNIQNNATTASGSISGIIMDFEPS